MVMDERGVIDICHLLKAFYENVKKEEFKIPDSEGGGGLAETFFNPEKQGWLTKEGRLCYSYAYKNDYYLYLQVVNINLSTVDGSY
jgi:hypothetical protein